MQLAPDHRRGGCPAERTQIAEAWLKAIGAATYLEEGQTSKNNVSYDDPTRS